MEPHAKPSIRTGLSRNTRVKPLLKSIPTPAKSKTSTPVPEVDMSPDQLSMDNAPGVANGVRRGVGLGNGLRSEANMAKRAARRSLTPTAKSTTSTTMTVSRQGSVGLGAEKTGNKGQEKEEEEKGKVEKGKVEKGKVEKGKLGKGAVQVAVQRRSGRNTGAAAMKPVVEEKAKAVKKRTKGKVDEKGYYHVGSDTDGETAGKAGKKTSIEPAGWEKEFLRNLASDMESLDSDSDLGFKVVSTTEKPARKPTVAKKQMGKIPAKDQAAPAKDQAAPAKDTADLRRTTRSAAAAAVENGKNVEKDVEKEPVSVLGKWRERKANEKRKNQEKEVSSDKSTGEESTCSKGSQKGSGKADPMVVDDMDCEKEDELFDWAMRTPYPSAQRNNPPITYKSAKGKKREMNKFLNGRLNPESNPPPRAKGKGTEEEPVFLEPEFIEPIAYVNLSTPAPQPTKQIKGADFLPEVEFKNPCDEYGTSPDHLENPKFANETMKATDSVVQVDLTISPFKKRKTKSSKYLSDSDESTLTSGTSSPTPHVLDDGLDEPSTLSLTSDPNICPICNDRFPDSFLLLNPVKVSYNMRIQLDRCRQHKRYAAEEFCKDKKYPAIDIDWRNLPRRIDAHIPQLTEILEQKRSSTYRDAVGQDLASIGNGKGKRKLMDTDWQSHTPGYYGPRGAHVMLATIMKKMANRIREVGSNDRLIAGGGVSAFVQSVLVPELGVRLVMEDLKCGEAKARKVVKETVEIGELINDEDEGGGSGGDYFDDDEEEGGKWVTL
ncbi:RTC4-like domain-containing protein [Tirmania nivea]|nr:RTC4-like domain-containing protein [Tirmania nivea]